MQFSSTIPPTPLAPSTSLPHDLELEELEDLSQSHTINAVLAETNACGFDISSAAYNQKTDTYEIQLKGVTPEGRCFCGDTVNIKAQRKDGHLKVLAAEVDRSYMQEEDLDWGP